MSLLAKFHLEARRIKKISTIQQVSHMLDMSVHYGRKVHVVKLRKGDASFAWSNALTACLGLEAILSGVHVAGSCEAPSLSRTGSNVTRLASCVLWDLTGLGQHKWPLPQTIFRYVRMFSEILSFACHLLRSFSVSRESLPQHSQQPSPSGSSTYFDARFWSPRQKAMVSVMVWKWCKKQRDIKRAMKPDAKAVLSGSETYLGNKCWRLHKLDFARGPSSQQNTNCVNKNIYYGLMGPPMWVITPIGIILIILGFLHLV